MSEQQPIHISEEVLSALGLKGKDLDVLAKLEREKELRRAGSRAYDSLSNPRRFPDLTAIFIYGERPIDYIDIPSVTPLDRVPDYLITSIPIEIRQTNPLDTVPNSSEEQARIEEVSREAKIWIEGFGKRALTFGDWKAAIPAYAVITEGGILRNERVVKTLRAIGRNYDCAYGIAKAIQETLKSPTE